ncbi:MAG: PAS domain-containing protein [Gammaproteobacteria bacterium]|nr:PAS domain-containing protein [Gammaproteobacteria bacterium]
MSKRKNQRENEDVTDFLIVGIGASAGGLKAATSFLENTPDDCGMAFVLVFHLDPRHESEAAELLQGHTKMPVAQIRARTPVEPNHVYVIPPDRGLVIRDGALELEKLEHADGRPTVIDRFFRALAEDAGERAVGVVLSGTGSEGSQGLKAIKEAGGLTVVQEEEEAEYAGMPSSAVATGLIDYVLPVAEMPAKLLEARNFARNFALPDADRPEGESDADTLQKIFVQLRTQVGHDFSHYKENTVLRRIARRMQVSQVKDLREYLKLLRAEPGETEALFHELLISVTNFFRDAESMGKLEHEVIPKLCKKLANQTLRVWVPGCATGEEAYSLAMLMSEACDELASPPQLQIFASDVDERALDVARRGVYPDAIAGDMSGARLRRFFERAGGGFVVKNSLREMILFTCHDLIRDPPFSRLDLISCRNLLIYLKNDLQNKTFSLFHFALNPEGYLFLGESESVGDSAKLFAELDRKAKIFQARRVPGADLHFSLLPLAGRDEPKRADRSAAPPRRFKEIARDQLLARHVPPCVIVDENYDVTWISGSVGKYLEPGAGEANYNLLNMAREGLRLDLRTALYRGFHGGETVCGRRVRVKTNGGEETVELTVEPLAEAEGHLLVLFEEPASGETAPEPLHADGEDGVIAQLETELADTRESLQTTIEELETSNEELRASNEELQSMNEELQSTTEELETGKEELQSTNEELLTVNQELQGKTNDLAQANDDLKNFIASTEIGTLFLDEELRVRRYTPRLTEIFNLISGDLGRPLGHITHNLVDEALVADAEHVLRDLKVIGRELQSQDGRYWQTSLRPFRTTDNRIGGVAITFVDVSERRRHEEATRALNVRLEAQKAYAESIIATLSEPLLVLDGDLRVVSASRAFYRLFEATRETTENKLIHELGGKQLDIPELRRLLEEILPERTTVEEFEVRQRFGAAERTLLLNARRMQRGKDSKPLILLAIEDVTERRRAEKHRKFLLNELNHRVKNTLATVQSIAMQTFAGSPADAELAWRFESRLMALAAAHDLLSRAHWRSISLHDLLARELAPFGGNGRDRVLVDGEDTRLRSNAALALGMAVHELATNAVKFGALSNRQGRVRVVSRLSDGADRRLRLGWTETGGPEVAKPERRGFGTRLVAAGLGRELGGEVVMDYRPEGFVCTIDIPLAEEEHDDEKP